MRSLTLLNPFALSGPRIRNVFVRISESSCVSFREKFLIFPFCYAHILCIERQLLNVTRSDLYEYDDKTKIMYRCVLSDIMFLLISDPACHANIQ